MESCRQCALPVLCCVSALGAITCMIFLPETLGRDCMLFLPEALDMLFLPETLGMLFLPEALGCMLFLPYTFNMDLPDTLEKDFARRQPRFTMLRLRTNDKYKPVNLRGKRTKRREININL